MRAVASVPRSAEEWRNQPVRQLDPEPDEHPGLRRAVDDRGARIL